MGTPTDVNALVLHIEGSARHVFADPYINEIFPASSLSHYALHLLLGPGADESSAASVLMNHS